MPLPVSASFSFSHRWKGADNYGLEINSFLGLSRFSILYVINVSVMANDSPQLRLKRTTFLCKFCYSILLFNFKLYLRLLREEIGFLQVTSSVQFDKYVAIRR